MAKQSIEDRKKRWGNGGVCPIHGLSGGQVEGWFYPCNGPAYTICECPRQDCFIRWKEYTSQNTKVRRCELLPEFAELIGETPKPSTDGCKRCGKQEMWFEDPVFGYCANCLQVIVAEWERTSTKGAQRARLRGAR
jgi:hypothetical protein